MKNKIFTLLITVTILFLISCSSDSSGNSAIDPGDIETPGETEHTIPTANFPAITLHQKVIDAANSGNIGAIQAQAAMEMAQMTRDYYESMQIPVGVRLPKITSPEIDNWTTSWQVGDLTVTLQFEDLAGLWFLNQYYDGTDGVYTYNNWLRGYFGCASDEFMGTLQIYQYGTSEPIIFFKWEMDALLDEFFEANFMNIYKIKVDLVNPTNDGSTILFEDGSSLWFIDVYNNGTGSWTQTLLGTQTVLDSGSWN